MNGGGGWELTGARRAQRFSHLGNYTLIPGLEKLVITVKVERKRAKGDKEDDI